MTSAALAAGPDMLSAALKEMARARRLRRPRSPMRSTRRMPPPTRQQPPHLAALESVVDQVDDAEVTGLSYHPTGGLHDLLQAGVEVGVVVAGAEHRLHALSELLVDRVDLWQAQGGQEGPDQTPTGQVDAFGEGTTQHREADDWAQQNTPTGEQLRTGTALATSQALKSLRKAVNWAHDKLPAPPSDPVATKPESGAARAPGGTPGKRG